MAKANRHRWQRADVAEVDETTTIQAEWLIAALAMVLLATPVAAANENHQCSHFPSNVAAAFWTWCLGRARRQLDGPEWRALGLCLPVSGRRREHRQGLAYVG